MSVTLVNGFLLLMSLFVALLALAGVLAQSRRLDRLERRRVYETECLVRSLQALEQQNLMLGNRLGSVADAGQKLAVEIDRAARRSTADDTGPIAPTAPRLLH